MVAGNVIRGHLSKSSFISPLLKAHIDNDFYSKFRFKAVQEVVVAPTLLEGARMLLLTSGVGKLRPNLLAYGFREAWLEASETELTYHYVESLRDALRMNFSIAILRNYVHDRYGRECIIDVELAKQEHEDEDEAEEHGHDSKRDPELEQDVSKDSASQGSGLRHRRRRTSFHNSDKRGRAERSFTSRDPIYVQPTYRWLGKYNRNQRREGVIDVWWLDDTGGLTVLLPHILAKKRDWRKCPLRVFITSSSSEDDVQRKNSTLELLRKVRIAVQDVIVVPRPSNTENADDVAAVKQTVNRYRDNMSSAEFDRMSLLNEGEEQSPGEIDPVSQQQITDESMEAGAQNSGVQVDATSSTKETETPDTKQDCVDQLPASVWEKAPPAIIKYRSLGRIIKQHTDEKTLLVVVSMPFPKVSLPSQVFMSILDGISGPCKKPVLFVRGTQKRVLTMDS